MRQAAITGVFLAVAALAVAGCVDVAVNKAWRSCKDDPCSDKCEADLRQQYCDFYEDSKCDRCWAPSDGGMGADSGHDGASADARVDAGDGDGDDATVAQCTRNLECSAEAPRCAGGECGLCKGHADCSGRSDTPACDSVSGACVLCTASKPDLCAVAGKVCKEGGGECVGCNTNDDCSESAPHCGSDNECGVCTADADCAKYGKVCDAGQCVQCTGTKTRWCNGFVCDSKARICAVGVLPETADLCEACVSDAQCGKGGPALCLPTSFGGQDLGHFCQPVLSAGESCIGDHRPYVGEAVDSQNKPLRSIDGSTDPSCKLRRTTCQALGDFGTRSCTGPADDAACGAVSVDDGVCKAVQTVYRCSVPCGTSDDCNEGFTCPLGGGACSL